MRERERGYRFLLSLYYIKREPCLWIVEKYDREEEEDDREHDDDEDGGETLLCVVLSVGGIKSATGGLAKADVVCVSVSLLLHDAEHRSCRRSIYAFTGEVAWRSQRPA